jgi:hypothetical protein
MTTVVQEQAPPEAIVPEGRAERLPTATLTLALVTAASLFFERLPLTQTAAVVGTIVLVGAFFADFISWRRSTLTQRVVVVVAFGVLAMFLVGAGIAPLLHAAGVARPLTRVPLLVTWLVVLAAVSLTSAVRRRDPVATAFDGLRLTHVAWMVPLAVPPLLALLGVAQLNHHRDAAWAITMGVLVVLLAGLAIALPERPWGPPRVLLLASALLTAAWQGPLRGGWLAGYDIQHEFSVASTAVKLGRFPIPIHGDPYKGMLSLTVWPAQVHALTGLSLRSILAFPPSIMLALCLVATWGAIRERVGPRLSALLCVLFLVASEPLLRELPSVTRQCYALFFFAVIVLAVSSHALAPRSARWVVAAAGVGIALSHYSSAYLAAGAVLVGWILVLAYRTPRESRTLTAPVVGVVVGSTIVWGLLIARTGSNFHQLATSIRNDGLRLLPGAGNPISRWLHGASVSQLVHARVIRANDTGLRLTYLRWMHVTSAANHIPLVNAVAPKAVGVPVLGALLSIGAALLSEVVLVGALLSVAGCLWLTVRDRRLAGLSGMAHFGALAAGLSRSSQTVAVEFGPTRVQAQMYLVFVVAVAVCAQALLRDRAALRVAIARWKAPLVAGGVALALVGTAYSTQVGLLAQRGGALPLQYSATGEQIERVPVPDDLAAAGYLARFAPRTTVVQADYFGQLALFDYGFAVGRRLVPSVDPIIIDNSAWVLATTTNLSEHRGRGGTVTSVGAFVFPVAYLTGTRAVLYTSSTNAVYGQIPYRYKPPAHTTHTRR